MQVAELAAEAGVSARSVRHYDRAGLLESTRLTNGHREFEPSAVRQVQLIKSLLAAGLSVADILTVRPCLGADERFRPCDEAIAVLTHHVQRLGSQIERDRRTLHLLTSKLPADPPASPSC